MGMSYFLNFLCCFSKWVSYFCFVLLMWFWVPINYTILCEILLNVEDPGLGMGAMYFNLLCLNCEGKVLKFLLFGAIGEVSVQFLLLGFSFADLFGALLLFLRSLLCLAAEKISKL